MKRSPATSCAKTLLGIVFFLATKGALAGEVTEAQRAEVRAGIAAYEQGNAEEALRLWIPVFRALEKPQRFRLAFNVARAADKLGKEEEAALHYEEFLEGLRNAKGLEGNDKALLEEEGVRASGRLITLRRSLARVAFADGEYTVDVEGRELRARDLVYLRPATYHMVFSVDGRAVDDRAVTLHAGESRVLAPEPAKEASPDPKRELPLPVRETPPPRPEASRGPPFPAAVLYVGAGLTLASTSLPIVTYLEASNYQEEHRLSSNIADEPRNASIRAEYANLETRYYLAMSVPITLGLATGALALWYALSPKRTARLEGTVIRF